MDEGNSSQMNQTQMKARTIWMYEDVGMTLTIDAQSSRRLNNSGVQSNNQSRDIKKKKKRLRIKKDEDVTVQYHSSYFNSQELHSHSQSRSINESIKQDSIDSIGRFSESKYKSKYDNNIKKPLTNDEINKLFEECNSTSQKGNKPNCQKLYIDSGMHLRNEIEYNVKSSIQCDQQFNSIHFNHNTTENSKKQTIQSGTQKKETFPSQLIQKQSPQRSNSKAQQQKQQHEDVDEDDFQTTIAKVHRINAYEPKLLKQLQISNQQNILIHNSNYYNNSNKNNNNNKISTASTQQDQFLQEKYPYQSESSIMPIIDNDEVLNSQTAQQSKKIHNYSNSPNHITSEVVFVSSNNNNLIFKKNKKLKKRNIVSLQTNQINQMNEINDLLDCKEPDTTKNNNELLEISRKNVIRQSNTSKKHQIREVDRSKKNEIRQADRNKVIEIREEDEQENKRIQANTFILSNHGSESHQATPINIQQLLNSTKQARRKSIIFHNSPRMIKNAYGIDQKDVNLRNLREQFKEKVKAIQEFNKNHTNPNFYKKRPLTSSKIRSPTNYNSIYMNDLQMSPQGVDVFEKQHGNTSDIGICSATQAHPPPSSSQSKYRRKSHQPNQKLQHLQLPLFLQNTLNNTPQLISETPSNIESLFNYINFNIPKSATNQNTNNSSMYNHLQQNDAQLSKLSSLRSKTPTIQSNKTRINHKNVNSPKHHKSGSGTKPINTHSILNLYSNTPRNIQN